MNLTPLKKIMLFITLLAWMALGLYVGAGGWLGMKIVEDASGASTAKKATLDGAYYEYDGITFKDKRSLLTFVQQNEPNRSFPWVFTVPHVFIPLVAALGFGAVGGAVQVLNRSRTESISHLMVATFTQPLFGATVGLLLFFLSLVLPAVLTTSSGPIRAETLVGLSLFGGLFSEQAYAWIEYNVLQKLFGNPKA